jgi:lipid-binding SYLF domain-containing protein
MKKKQLVTLLLVVLIVMIGTLAGCAAPKGNNASDKRWYSQNMRSEAVQQLYRFEPSARSEIANAPGYAVFEAVQTQFLIASTGNASGIVRDNQTGVDTYMSAFSGGAGFGLGVKGFRAIIIFKERSIMNEFVNNGWVFGVSGTADAKAGDDGGSISGAANFDDRMKVYTFTDTGLMAGASLRGVKVWKNKELNINISSTTNESLAVKELRTPEYIVKHGDSLWQISAKLLGDGNRYREIIELNKEAIQDEKSISVGMHLKMPCK